MAVVGTTFVLQLALVQCSGRAFRCYEGGLSPQEWLFCLAVGAGSLPMQLFINLLASMNRTPGSGREGGCLKFKSPFGDGRVHFSTTPFGKPLQNFSPALTSKKRLPETFQQIR